MMTMMIQKHEESQQHWQYLKENDYDTDDFENYEINDYNFNNKN